MPDDKRSDECCACSEAANEHVLSEYYGMPPDAKKALDDGVTAILGEKGGFLCIPPDAVSEKLVPRNLKGHHALDANRTDFDSVTVVDARRGVERRYLPPVGDDNSELTTFAGQILERDLAVDLGWQGSYAVESLCSRMRGGGSSVSMRLADATAMNAKRFYVPTLIGIFPGQKLKIDLLEDLFTVDLLGQDAKGLFFETREAAPRNIPKEAPLYNKNNVNVLALSDTTNSDNQGVELEVHRRAYGVGDVFPIAAILEYQSNIYSGLGDEGGVGCAIELLNDLEAFHGEVESWTQVPGRETVAVYKPTGDAPPPRTRNTQKLGTSRPLINLNRTKWKFDGVANVVPPNVNPADPRDVWLPGLPAPDHLNGLILLRPQTPPADWKTLVGRFIALLGRPGIPDTIDNTDATEFYRKGEATPLGNVAGDVHRWWFITGVQDAGGGRAYVYVDRSIQRTHEVVKAGPLLFCDVNATEGKVQVDERRLRYVIAPGSWVTDVRNGVAGNVLGNEGAQPTDPRRIVLAPGQPELAKDDPITNAPGPDVLHPTGFRVRQIHHFPGIGQGAAFASENLGRLQVGSGLHVGGAVKQKRGESIPDALKRVQKDQRPLYVFGVHITAPTTTAIRIQGYTERAAIELFQYDCDQAIEWWSADGSDRSTIHRDRGNGDFVLTADIGVKFVPATLTGPFGVAMKQLHGLSSTMTAARNLCGQQAVAAGAAGATVIFDMDRSEADGNYRVFVQCTWQTTTIVTARSATEFKVTFGTAPTGNETFDWLLVR